MNRSYTITGKVWMYGGKATWYFITVPPTVARDIDFFCAQYKRGWGSLKVQATIGSTMWSTSIFPDKKTTSYLLPIKASVRKAEDLQENHSVTARIDLVC